MHMANEERRDASNLDVRTATVVGRRGGSNGSNGTNGQNQISYRHTQSSSNCQQGAVCAERLPKCVHNCKATHTGSRDAVLKIQS